MKLNFKQFLIENAEINVSLGSISHIAQSLIDIYKRIETNQSIGTDIQERLVNLLSGHSGLLSRLASYFKKDNDGRGNIRISRQDLVLLKAKFLELSSIAKQVNDHKISQELEQLSQMVIKYVVVKLTNEKQPQQDSPSQEYVLKNGEKLVEYVKLHFSVGEHCFKLIGTIRGEQFKTSCLNKIEVAQGDYIRFHTRNSVYIAKLSPKDLQKIAPALNRN